MNLAVQEAFRIETHIQILHQKRKKALRVLQRNTWAKVQCMEGCKEPSDKGLPENVGELPTCSSWLCLWRHSDTSESEGAGSALQPWGSLGDSRDLSTHFSFRPLWRYSQDLMRHPSHGMHKRPKLVVQRFPILQYHPWLLGCLRHCGRSTRSTHLFWFLAQLFQSLLMIGETGPHNRFNSEIRGHWERGNEWWRSVHSTSFHSFWARNQKSRFLVLDLSQLGGWTWTSDLLSLGLSILSIHRGVIVSHLCEHLWERVLGKRNSEVWQWCSYETNTCPVHPFLIKVLPSYSSSLLAAAPLLLFWWR